EFAVPNFVVVHGVVNFGDADDVGIGALGPEFDQGAGVGYLRHGAGDGIAPADRVGIVEIKRVELGDHATTAALDVGGDEHLVGAHRRETAEDARAHTFENGHRGDNGGDPENDAERRQHGAERMDRQAAKGHQEDAEKEHQNP